MSNIEEKINSLIGKQIERNGQLLTVKSGKETSLYVVLRTDKFPINFHKHSLEFKNLTPVEPSAVVSVPNAQSNQSPINLESKMNTQNQLPTVEKQNYSNPQIARALDGSAELKDTLLDTLNKLKGAKTPTERKEAIEEAKAVSMVGRELNDLFKTGVRAVEVINKI